MFTEANTILTTVFAFNPFNPVARTLRMLIYLNMAMTQNDFGLFELYFDRAKKEGNFVMKYCGEEEEIWCEYGLLFWTRAIYLLRQLRTWVVTEKKKRNDFKARLLSDLEEAELCFQKGMIFSPTVNRPGFWIVHLKSLHTMIRLDETITDSTMPIRDTMGTYPLTSIKFFISLGWIDPFVITLTDPSEQLKHLNFFVARMSYAVSSYYNSVHLRMYKPNVAFSIATVLWDFSPIITVKIAKIVLEWLERSRFNATQVLGSQTGLFSIISWYSQIQDPEHFIDCIDRAMGRINAVVKSSLHLHNDTVIDPATLDGLKLFPLFFDE